MSRVGSPQNVCFYSNNCKWSKAFLTELAKTPYKKDFAFHCVDPAPNRPPLPTWLKKVPTLIVQGEQEPLTDGEVMNWLSIKKLRDGGGGNNGPPVPTRGPQGQGHAQVQQEPEAYMWGEMGGSLTKPFSFVDNSGEWFGDAEINEGDWIVFRPSDGWSITVNGVLCRMIDDVNVKARVDQPDRVW